MQQNPHSHQPYPHGGDAASRLQLMALKAAAQNIGLDPGMLGWAMLERLVSEGNGSGTTAIAGSSGASARQEWNEIWSAISTGKVCFAGLLCNLILMYISFFSFFVGYALAALGTVISCKS
jgi:hypothetical protein